jgi:hypothetical protein
MYFHTAWRSGNRILFGSNSNQKDIKDWNYVTISGKGVFVGDSLSLYNRPVMGGALVHRFYTTGWTEGRTAKMDGENRVIPPTRRVTPRAHADAIPSAL